jgi:hypothetical protein
MSSFIFRDSSQVVAAQGDKIIFLSSFSCAPTFENSENTAPDPLRRKDFGKIGEDCRVDVRPIRSVCLR